MRTELERERKSEFGEKPSFLTCRKPWSSGHLSQPCRSDLRPYKLAHFWILCQYFISDACKLHVGPLSNNASDRGISLFPYQSNAVTVFITHSVVRHRFAATNPNCSHVRNNTYENKKCFEWTVFVRSYWKKKRHGTQTLQIWKVLQFLTEVLEQDYQCANLISLSKI